MAFSMSAAAKTMLGLLPPSSRATRLRFESAAARMMRWPPSVEPVKATLSASMRGASAGPAGGGGDMIGLAVVGRGELRRCVGILCKEVRSFVHKIAAVRGRELLAPSARLESGARGADGLVDIGGVGFRYLGDDFAG